MNIILKVLFIMEKQVFGNLIKITLFSELIVENLFYFSKKIVSKTDLAVNNNSTHYLPIINGKICVYVISFVHY